MDARKLSAGFAALALVVTMAVGFVVFAPNQVTAQTYSAGNQNGPICSCPVDVGNCICQWNPPKETLQAE